MYSRPKIEKLHRYSKDLIDILFRVDYSLNIWYYFKIIKSYIEGDKFSLKITELLSIAIM